MGSYIWYSEEGTVLFYNGPLLCDFDVPIKGLICMHLRQAYDRILLRSILQMSENVKLCSDRLHYYFRFVNIVVIIITGDHFYVNLQ